MLPQLVPPKIYYRVSRGYDSGVQITDHVDIVYRRTRSEVVFKEDSLKFVVDKSRTLIEPRTISGEKLSTQTVLFLQHLICLCQEWSPTALIQKHLETTATTCPPRDYLIAIMIHNPEQFQHF